ncbi:MAG: hypothetical protein JSS10_02640 [Verrucomicrobia bacterium]|nr:hypothetical protein [Verrucomicrobiota bacterium]
MGSTNTSNPFLSNSIPENTLESFKQAIISGADGIEVDIFETRNGHLLIIHDDELWKNVYNVDRNGLELPAFETQSSFRVSQKDLVDLEKLSVGPMGQKSPVLSEVFELIEEANEIRQSCQTPPIIINIDVKSPKVSKNCLKWVESYLQKNKAKTINFSHIYFTSSDPEALRVIQETNIHHHRRVNTVLQITTEQIYGKENTGENYMVKNPSRFNLEYLDSLKKMIQTHRIGGIDCVVWDINPFLINLCKKEQLELHLYVSNFKYSKHDQDLARLILSLSNYFPVYLKTDHLNEKISILSQLKEDEYSAGSKEDDFISFFPLKKPNIPSNSR